jgi:hypothetical protein
VSVARREGGRCRFARRDGTLGAPRSCSDPVWLRAALGRRRVVDGKVEWSLRLGGALPEGSYVAKVRGRDVAGNVELPHRPSNRTEFSAG